MKKLKIKTKITKKGTGYNANISAGKLVIDTEAQTLEELKANISEAVNFVSEVKDFVYDEKDLQFEYDLGSFFDLYRVINAKALSERIGMSQSLLAQYIKGIKKPSAAQIRRILQGVHQIGQELSEVRLLS